MTQAVTTPMPVYARVLVFRGPKAGCVRHIVPRPSFCRQEVASSILAGSTWGRPCSARAEEQLTTVGAYFR